VSADSEKQVLDYLDRVADEAQRRIRHPAERIRLVEELRARIDKAAARRGNQPKAVRKILTELGPAERQVDDFLVRGSPSGPSVPPPRPGTEEVARPAPPRAEVRARAEASARTEPPRSDPAARPEPTARPEPSTRPEPTAPSATPPPAGARPEPATAPPMTTPRAEPGRSAARVGEPPRASAEADTTPVQPVGQPAGQPAITGPIIRTERPGVAGMPVLAFVAVVLLGVAVVTLLFGWIGWLIGALIGLKWPPAARGVRVIALMTIPLVGLPVFLLLGLGTDVDEVLTRIYPLVVGLLGAAFLLWGHFRYRAPAERQPPPPPRPRRPQRRLVRGLSRHSRG
jgi:hypothetical protein